MDLGAYRNSGNEKLRSESLLKLVPSEGVSALDIGARDGHFSRLLAQRFERVVALDLEKPSFTCSKVECVSGDITRLAFPDRSFEFVFCAEVLEHISPAFLPVACAELARVCSKTIVIGVPNEQEIRVGRTTCAQCGKPNPPWGHVKSFDRRKLEELFPSWTIERCEYVGQRCESTNAVSTSLLDYAGNPYGTYDQEEPCIHCGGDVGRPKERRIDQKIATRLAALLRSAQEAWHPRRAGNWIHIRLHPSA